MRDIALSFRGRVMRPIVIFLSMLVVFALAGTDVFAAEQTPPHVGPWPGWHSHGTGFWWICPLMMLFMFAIFAAVYFVVRRRRGDLRPPWRWMSEHPEARHLVEGYQDATSESAVDILNKRYARGELEKEEYEEKKAAIASAES